MKIYIQTAMNALLLIVGVICLVEPTIPSWIGGALLGAFAASVTTDWN